MSQYQEEFAMSEEPRITFFQGSDVGKVRDHNEDWVATQDPADPEMKRKGRLFIVADGMGGYQAGEVASQVAAETVIREYYADPSEDPAVRLQNAMQAANDEVYLQAQNNAARAGMGTTMVVTVQIGRKAYIASVGDSRAYVVHNDELSQITQDHSFVGEQVRAGILTKEQARVHPQRNVITRALGSQPDVQVDTFVGELSDGDVLLMCTDGLTGHVPEDRICDTVISLPPDQVVPQLIQMAKDDGGTDNISVIALRVEPPMPGPATLAPAPQPESEAATVMMSQPTTQPASAALPKRKGGSSLIWLAVGLLVVLIGLIALGLVVFGVSRVLSVDGLWTSTPAVAPASPQVFPTVVPVGTVTTLATALPTQTGVPTPAPRLSPVPTLPPLIQISPLMPKATSPTSAQSPLETPVVKP
jgi:serine/threonine protein phosphatase PrpC